MTGTYVASATLLNGGIAECNHCGEILLEDERHVHQLHTHVHDCNVDRDLNQVDHPENRSDWSVPGSSQGYQVYKCKVCGDYWGCRYQWDAGTGDDDSWKRFAATPESVRRHY